MAVVEFPREIRPNDLGDLKHFRALVPGSNETKGVQSSSRQFSEPAPLA